MPESFIFDGKPSIKLNHRPFFSIIIACYNSGRYLDKLLTSILDQHMSDDIEVILSDDHSTEDYTDVVKRYDDKLCIKRVQTDYNCAPGNTRERGTHYATGEWLAFADHDDMYVHDTLSYVKEKILESGEKYYVVSNFLEANIKNDEVIRAFKFPLGWNHAKFYNLDNAWKAYDVHFKKDLLSHEDIYISSTMNCLMSHINRKPFYVDCFTYVWYCNPDSLSHAVYEKEDTAHPFLEVFFADYLRSTASVYFEQYLKGKINREYAKSQIIQIIAYSYFYIQGFLFHNPNNYIKENYEWARGLLVLAKKIFGLTNVDIWNALGANDANEFTKVYNSAQIGSGPFIAYQTLMDYLDYLHTDGKEVDLNHTKFIIEVSITK